MAWKNVKARRGKHQMKRFSADKVKFKGGTLTSVARVLSNIPSLKGEGAAVLYRDHVKSASRGTHTPAPKYDFQRYEGVKDEQVPPLIRVLRRRAALYHTAANGARLSWWEYWHHMDIFKDQYLHLVLAFSGKKAFFVELDLFEHTVRDSIEYTTDRARELIKREQTDRIYWRPASPL